MTLVKLGSSPYQKIQSSLATDNERVGATGAATDVNEAKGSRKGPLVGTPGVCEFGGLPIRRHTHRISLLRHLE